MKKLIIFVVSLSLISGVSGVINVMAQASDIPEKMQPETIIEYISDSEYIILAGGKNEQEQASTNIDLSKNYPYVVEKLPKPVKGMKVTYATDGYILNIIPPENGEVVYAEEVIQPNDNGITPYIADYYKLVATWGSYPNKLYRIPGLDSTIGTGRGTTFSDVIGQANHVLVKGDVATKLAYDNCANGKTLIVIHNGKAVHMKKWDVGGMPNAVIDIWKTGVEYWGYKWNSTFSLPGYVEYHH